MEHGGTLQLGALYEDLKFPWRARPHYLKVLEIDASNAKALERLQLIDAESGEMREERAFMDRILHHSSK